MTRWSKRRVVTWIQELPCRRIAGEPLQYITGQCEFMGLGFSVGEGAPLFEGRVSRDSERGV